MSKQTANQRGIFIAVEGSDGSGKGTQTRLLVERLEKSGYDVETFDFPQYDESSSYFIKEYLNGNYGNSDEVGPFTASLFFALDRYQAAIKIREAIDAGKVVITNRFTGSNMAHQGTKFSNAEERRGYFIWLDNLEFQMLGIPRPDYNFVLNVPAETAQELVDQKEARNYTTLKRDIHEADIEHLKKSVEIYTDMTKLFPKDFTRIDCVRGGKLLSVAEIHNLLWEKVATKLPKAPKKGTAMASNTESKESAQNPYVEKQDGRTVITAAGKKYLEDAVTSVDGNVYAFTDKFSPMTISAAMARLSRRGDDMRITILDEFANAMGKDEKLLQRVITAYGDDSVQQLAGMHFVVENTTKLMSNFLEWGRLAAYLEQSTRYIYFDQKDANGRYKYYIPAALDEETRDLYVKVMDVIFDTYSDMVHKLTKYVGDKSDVPEAERDIAWKGAVRAQACDAARHALPTATTTTIGFYASGQALESLIMHLQSNELQEAKDIGQDLLVQARKVMPVLLERADKPERGGATIAYRANTHAAVAELADEVLPAQHASTTESVKLTSYWPRNEYDLIPDMLYEHSSLPLEEIKSSVAKLTYDKKQMIFDAYMGERLNRRHKPGRALEKAHYSWDLVCDFGIFCDLQRHRMVDDMEWQHATPRYGYEIPELIEEAGLTDQFEQCFDLSLKLYSLLQEKGYGLEAQYATLLGHKMRWKVTYNAREAFHLHELRTSPQGHPGYRKLVLEMHEKLAEVHPQLAAAMKFVNTGEDEALTRLAAERYTQFKLQNMQ